MAPKSKKGMEDAQDKDKLLQLAATISSGKERDARAKIDRTRAAGASLRARSSPRGAGSDKLRAAKAAVAARQARLKREKAKARRRQDGRASGTGDAPGGAPKRKSVSFA